MKVSRPILNFKFDFDKFVATVSIFAKHIKKDLDKLKICKLIYYADKYHLINYGNPIIGDRYVHLQRGPVPSLALDIMNDILDSKSPVYPDSSFNKFTEYLITKKIFFHAFPVFVLKKAPDEDCLSESELEAIKNTIDRYGKFSSFELIEATHKESPWLKTTQTSSIDYRLFFDEEPEAKPAALEYLESLRDHYEISLSLEQNG